MASTAQKRFVPLLVRRRPIPLDVIEASYPTWPESTDSMADVLNQHRAHGPKKNNTSGFKGVFRTKSKSRPWEARIYVFGRQRYLGCYATKRYAAMVYDAAALRTFGSGAYLNLNPNHHTE